ncbi:MAG: divalent metal cation transporter [Firmicutes bacterium]|nr:divalent metal cation transporter [Bacillota bacterium]
MKSDIKKLFNKIGPGFITGASDDDPSGIATYSQTGAIFGYGQLWFGLVFIADYDCHPKNVQADWIVKGKGLSGVIRTHYSKKVLYVAVFLLLLANTIFMA